MSDFLPLLPSQFSIVYHAMLNDKYPEVYCVQHVVEFKEIVNFDVLQRACQKIIERNDVLKGYISFDACNELKFRIQSYCNVQLQYIDLTRETSIRSSLKNTIDIDRKKGLDIFKPPLFRFTLIKVKNNHYYFLWLFHHVLLGGDSMIIMKELLECYYNEINHSEAKLPILKEYRNFVENFLNNDNDSAKRYWNNLLKDHINDAFFMHNINTEAQNLKQQYKNFTIKSAIKDKLKFVLEKKNIKLNIFLQAAWAILLSKYYSKKDIVFGTVRAFPSKITHQFRGPLYNTFPARVLLDNNMSIMKVIRNLASQNQKMKDFFYASPNQTSVKYQKSNQLFNTIIEYKNCSFEHYFKQHSHLQHLNFSFKVDTDMTLCMEIYDEVNTISGRLQYDSRMIDGNYANEIIQHFILILEEMAKKIDGSINEIDILTVNERNYIKNKLTEKSRAALKEYSPENIADYLTKQVMGRNNSTALVSSNFHITYQELYEKVCRLTLQIRKNKKKFNVPIAVFLYNKSYQIVSIISALNADCYYIPIDITWPAERIKYTCQLIGTQTILCDSKSIINIREIIANDKATYINVDKILNNIGLRYPTFLPPQRLSNKESLAYVIFTSGTTGIPKGVKISHKNVINTIEDINDICKVTTADAVLALSNITFDLSVYDIFGMLAKGAKIVIPLENEILEPQCWSNLILRHEVTIWNSVPAYMQMFLTHLATEDSHIKNKLRNQLRIIMLSGDRVECALLRKLKNFFINSHIICLGGATEGSIWSIYYDTRNFKNNLKLVPYGLPLPHQSIYILDENKQLCGFNMPGEIGIGGEGVAIGYVTINESDNEKFFFHDALKQKIYMTGDQGYLSNTGDIIILGRKDLQVKINGYRIELGEIENVVNQLEGIHAIASVYNKTTLVVYYTNENLLYSVNDIKIHCSRYLPAYMVPEIVIRLDKFEMNNNGKIDRNKLPTPIKEKYSENSIFSEDVVYKRVFNIFTKVLNIKNMPAYQDVFKYGINSIRSVEILARINKTFNVDLSLNDFFSNSNISAMTTCLKNRVNYKEKPISTSTFIQESKLQKSIMKSIWYTTYRMNNNSSYNVPLLWLAQGNINIGRLRKSLLLVLGRHNIFGSYFKFDNTSLIQSFDRKYLKKVKISIIDVSYIENDAIQKILERSVNIPFDLSSSPLVRIELFKKNDAELFILFCTHHIIFDKQSEEIFIRDLISCYVKGRVNNSQCNEKALEPQNKNYINKSELDNYTNLLKTASPAAIPYDKAINHQYLPNAAYKDSQIEVNQNLLSELMLKNQVTEFVILISIFQLHLFKITKKSEHIIGTPVSCRNFKNDQIGMYTNTLPLYCRVDEKASFSEFINFNKVNIMNFLNLMNVPFAEFVKKVNPDRKSANPLFNILFVHSEAVTNTYKFSRMTVEKLPIDLEFSKFDLTFFITKVAHKYFLKIEYNKNLYLDENIENYIKTYQDLVKLFLNYPDKKILDIFNMISSRRSISSIRGEFRPSFLQESIIDRFTKIASYNPQKLAISFKDHKYTYNELDILSSSIAFYLQSNYGNEKVIALASERSAISVVIIIAILKSRNIFMPLDSKIPQQRISYMVQNADVGLIIYDKFNEIILNKITGPQTAINFVSVDKILNGTEQRTSSFKANKISPSDSAYLLYTSGTTGTPKKICLPHKTLVNLILWQESTNFHYDYNIAQFNSMYFDVSLQEIFYALLTGKNLIIVPEEIKIDFPKLVQFLNNKVINKLFIPTVLLDLFANHVVLRGVKFEHLNEIITAGDKLVITKNIRQMFALQSRDVVLTNHYGPSETHVITSYNMILRNSNYLDLPPIGKPIANINITLKNDAGDVPQGMPGEIWVKGEALPYYNRKQPIYYKTGDLASLNYDGNIHFIDRVNMLVKIAGHRIDLTEIKLILTSHKFVADCYVLLPTGKNVICAFLELNSLTSKKIEDPVLILNNFVRMFLPEYMIPKIFICREIPHLSNGKVDVQSLLQIAERSLNVSIEIFDDDIQKEICAIYSEILHIDSVDKDKDFFMLGGTSFQALHLLNLLEKRLNIRVTINEFINNSSLPSLYAIINKNIRGSKIRNLVNDSIIVELKPGIKKVPIVLLHPIGGTLFCFKNMVNYFYDKRRILGIQDPLLYGNKNIKSVKELATFYVNLLLEDFQEYDSFILCGASFGSIIAAEMSLLLKKNGKKIPYLGIFDGWAMIPKFTQEKSIFNLMTHYDFMQNKNNLLALGIDNVNKYLKIRKERFQQLLGHEIRYIHDKLHLFKATDSIDKDVFKYNGWDNYCNSKINTYLIPGNHETMFLEPNVYSLTETLIESLNEVE